MSVVDYRNSAVLQFELVRMLLDLLASVGFGPFTAVSVVTIRMSIVSVGAAFPPSLL